MVAYNEMYNKSLICNIKYTIIDLLNILGSTCIIIIIYWFVIPYSSIIKPERVVFQFMVYPRSVNVL